MQTGTKISAIAHTILIGWALFGGTFRSEPLPFEVQEVSVISAEEFAALSSPRSTPRPTARPVAPDSPEPQPQDVTTPEPDAPEPQPVPDPVPRPEADPEPVPDVPVLLPEPEVPETTPSLEEPEPDIAALPEPPGRRPMPRPADRVAPEPVAPPDPDVRPDEVETPPVAEDDGAETRQEPQEATAPEEATDTLVTEATETDDTAPLRSPRPPATRPERPQTVAAAPEPDAPAAQPEADAAPSTSPDAVNDALAEALAGDGGATDAPTGPPITGAERDAFRVAVQRCWAVDVGSQAANVIVVVGMNMDRSGKVVPGSLRMISSEGGQGRAVETAFQAARRAIIRCQNDGYDLPADKYDHWKDIEITFDPQRMRNR